MRFRGLIRAAFATALAAPLGCGSGDDVAPTETAAALEAAESAAQAADLRGATRQGGMVSTDPAGNRPPEIARIRFEPDRPRAGEPLRARVQASDPDGDRVQLTYKWKLAGHETKGGGERIVLNGFRKGDRVAVSVIASDGELQSRAVSAETRIANREPSLLDVSIDPSQDVVAGAELRARPNVQDLDGDDVRLTYEWRVGGSVRAREGETFATQGLKRGDTVTVSVRASDGSATTDPVESKPVKIANTPPEITSQPAAPGPDGVFRYQIAAEDADADRGLIFALEKGPDGMSVDRTAGSVLWEPKPDQTGVFPIVLLVDDRKGGKTRQTFELTVGTPDTPAAPAP